MRIVDLKERAFDGDATGVHMTWAAELTTPSTVAVHGARMAAGSTLPRHPTPSWQVFAVVAGSGSVAGDDDAPQPIRAGQAAVWSPGEQHTSWAETDMTVLLVQSREEPAV